MNACVLVDDADRMQAQLCMLVQACLKLTDDAGCMNQLLTVKMSTDCCQGRQCQREGSGTNLQLLSKLRILLLQLGDMRDNLGYAMVSLCMVMLDCTGMPMCSRNGF